MSPAERAAHEKVATPLSACTPQIRFVRALRSRCLVRLACAHEWVTAQAQKELAEKERAAKAKADKEAREKEARERKEREKQAKKGGGSKTEIKGAESKDSKSADDPWDGADIDVRAESGGLSAVIASEACAGAVFHSVAMSF